MTQSTKLHTASSSVILAIVGMPGSGKSEATEYVAQKGATRIRFGEATDEGLKEMGLPITPENEQFFREKLRHDFGMAAYAIKAKPEIDEALQKKITIVLDGLYSWEEYIYLKEIYTSLFVITVFAERKVRYYRLAKRNIRPLSEKEAENRDIAEIDKLNKGGPIAMADYLIDNSKDKAVLYRQIDELLIRLGINL